MPVTPYLTSELLALLRARSVRDNPYAIDVSACSMFSEAAPLIGEIIYEHTEALGVAAIGGQGDNAIPLVTAAIISYALREKTMEGFWVRGESRKTTRIAGNLKPASRVVIVEDICISGYSALNAVQTVQDVGCQVALVLALIDCSKGAAERFRSEGIEYRAIYRLREDDEGVWSGDFTGGPIS